MSNFITAVIIFHLNYAMSEQQQLGISYNDFQTAAIL